jgi:nitrogenase molybdenum-iron protein alpha chain
VRGAVLVQHSPIGCGTGQVIYNSIYRNGLAMRGLPVECLHLISTNLTEKEMVFGGVAKLEQSIRDAWDWHHPRAIFIATSCATGSSATTSRALRVSSRTSSAFRSSR